MEGMKKLTTGLLNILSLRITLNFRALFSGHVYCILFCTMYYILWLFSSCSECTASCVSFQFTLYVHEWDKFWRTIMQRLKYWLAEGQDILIMRTWGDQWFQSLRWVHFWRVENWNISSMGHLISSFEMYGCRGDPKFLRGGGSKFSWQSMYSTTTVTDGHGGSYSAMT